MVHLHNIDCLEYMATQSDNAFDLAIVDPPYGIGNWVQTSGNIRRNGDEVTWNNNTPDESYFIELRRVSKEQIIWGANYYNCFSSNGGAIIWDKKNPNPNFSVCEIASYSRVKRVARVVIPHYGFVGEKKNFHPCAKPVKLYRWILENYAVKEYRILDTHLGSGSSAIAAFYYGVDFVGCEIDKDYYDAACKRFNETTRQGQLFGPANKGLQTTPKDAEQKLLL